MAPFVNTFVAQVSLESTSAPGTGATATDGLPLPPLAVWGNLAIYVVAWLLLMWPQHLPLGRPSIAVVFAALACGLRAVCTAAWPAERYPTVDIYGKVSPTPIALLFGLMLVNAYLKDTDLWNHVGSWLDSRSPVFFLLKICAFSALLSAVLMNDTICFVLTPVILKVCRKRDAHHALPYLLALSTSSNIGSSLTIIGNPQNALIASISPGISFLGFLMKMLAPVIVGLVLNSSALLLWFRRDLVFNKPEPTEATSADDVEVASAASAPMSGFPWRLYLAAIAVIVLLMIVGWLLGLSTGDVALAAGAMAMLARAMRRRAAGCSSAKTETDFGLGAIDYSILLLFVGQFILVGTSVDTGLPQKFFRFVLGPCSEDLVGSPGCVLWFSGLVLLLSNVLSNVPVILMLQPLLSTQPAATVTQVWLVCAWVATVAGNLTMLGSAANLIVAQTAEGEGECSYTASALGPFAVASTLVVAIAGLLLLPPLGSPWSTLAAVCAAALLLATWALLQRCFATMRLTDIFPSREAVALFVLSLLSAADGLGPFQGAWLTANPFRQYTPQELGQINGFAQALSTVLVPFLGWLTDTLQSKRLLVGLGSMCAAVGVALTVFLPQFVWLQFLVQVPMALGVTLVPVVIGALTLGTTEPEDFTRQVVLNSVGSHMGTILSSLAMALCALFGPKLVLSDGTKATSPVWSIVPLALATLAIASVGLLRRDRIDHARAAGSAGAGTGEATAKGAQASSLTLQRSFWQLLVLTFTFNFANMAQLQLLVERAAALKPEIAIPFTCAAQVIAHLVMTGSAAVVGALADGRGRKPLLVAACAVVSARALLAAAAEIWWVARGGSLWLALVPCQALDGVGAGLWAVLLTLVVQDISAGTGCFNLAFGCAQAAFSVGAVASSLAAGALTESFGFGAAFAVLAAIGALAVVQAVALPETLQQRRRPGSEEGGEAREEAGEAPRTARGGCSCGGGGAAATSVSPLSSQARALGGA